MSNCKSCGEEIKWLKTRAGKNIPVNIPDSIEEETKHDAVISAVEFNKDYMVAHFATCPQANKHRNKNKSS